MILEHLRRLWPHLLITVTALLLVTVIGVWHAQRIATLANQLAESHQQRNKIRDLLALRGTSGSETANGSPGNRILGMVKAAMATADIGEDHLDGITFDGTGGRGLGVRVTLSDLDLTQVAALTPRLEEGRGPTLRSIEVSGRAGSQGRYTLRLLW